MTRMLRGRPSSCFRRQRHAHRNRHRRGHGRDLPGSRAFPHLSGHRPAPRHEVRDLYFGHAEEQQQDQCRGASRVRRGRHLANHHLRVPDRLHARAARGEAGPAAAVPRRDLPRHLAATASALPARPRGARRPARALPAGAWSPTRRAPTPGPSCTRSACSTTSTRSSCPGITATASPTGACSRPPLDAHAGSPPEDASTSATTCTGTSTGRRQAGMADRHVRLRPGQPRSTPAAARTTPSPTTASCWTSSG